MDSSKKIKTNNRSKKVNNYLWRVSQTPALPLPHIVCFSGQSTPFNGQFAAVMRIARQDEGTITKACAQRWKILKNTYERVQSLTHTLKHVSQFYIISFSS